MKKWAWIKSRKRKVHQRKMNELMRLINKNIEQDDLWKGRYIVRQVSSQWYDYLDGSGSELWVVLRFKDRLTGYTWDTAETVNHWRWINGCHMWKVMNDFIVDRCSTWEQEPRPGTPEYKEMIDKYVREGWPHAK